MTLGDSAAVRVALRVVAFGVALGAIVDPSISSERTAKPVVLVSAIDSTRDSRLVDVVANAMRRQFVVARAPIAGASAAVIVGDGLPPSSDNVPTPSFVVVADSDRTGVEIERVVVPAGATLDERVPVRALIRVRAAGAGRSLELTARAGGTVVDRVTRQVTGDSTFLVPMSFVPVALGPVAVRISASLSGADSPAVFDAAVNVESKRRSVLFYDPRPSWMSTFVRRAIEHDPQFIVTSRIVTSRNVSTNVGQPPATLGGGDESTLAAFDAVVIGAPSALSAADVGGLEAFMRRRGGSVLFLLDEATSGPYERLVRNSVWSASSGTPAAFALAHSDSTMLRAGDVVVPANLPAAATVIAGGNRPVVWETPVGAGRLIVSGARDAWRFRDAAASSFDRFWRTLVRDAVASAPPPLQVEASPALAKPGETVELHATVRDAMLAAVPPDSVRISISAKLEPDTRVRMLPGGDVGRFSGVVRAPERPGVHRVTVSVDGRTAETPLIVSTEARTDLPVPFALSSAWAASRGGRLIQAKEIGNLAAALSAAIRPVAERTTWHPFRSAWWIVPFVLVLSMEWWLRRRQGLR